MIAFLDENHSSSFEMIDIWDSPLLHQGFLHPYFKLHNITHSPTPLFLILSAIGTVLPTKISPLLYKGGVASLIAVNHSEVIDQDQFSGRPQYKLQLNNDITFLGIHLDAPVSPHRYHRRQRQLSFLAEFIKQSETPVILAGDFNTYFNESIFQRFMALIDSPQSHSSIERPLTWPSVFPLFQIDHILCSQHLKLTQLQKGHFNGSDHLPIYGCVVRKEA